MAGPIRIRVEQTGAQAAARDLDQLSTRASRVASSFRKMAVPAAAALAGIAAGAFKATQAAAEDEASQARLAQTVKTATDARKADLAATERWISAQGKALGVADDDLRPAIGKLAVATGDLGQAQKLAAIAMDVSAGSGKSLEAVTDALVRAQNGSIGGLSRLGIATKNAAGETLTMEQVTRNMAATYSGAAAAAADTAAGKQQRLQVALGELQEEIGARLLPVLTRMAQVGLQAVEWIGANQGKVVALVAVIGALAAGVLLVNGVMAVAGAVMTVYGAGQALLAKNAARAAAGQWALNAAMLANPIGLVVVALVALGAGLVIAYKKSETFRNIVNGAWAAVRAATGAVFGWVQDKVSSVMTFVGTTLPSKARSAVEGAVNAWTSLRERTTAMFEAVVTAVRQKIGNVVETVTGLKDKVTGALSGAGTWLTEIGKNIIQGLVNGLDAAKQWVIDKIQEITDSIPGWVKKRLGIASPSKVMAELGREAGRGLVVGLDGERSQVERSADLLARTLVKGFGTPQLTARAVVAGTPGLQLGAAGGQPAPGSSGVMRVEFTAEQLHEIERGRRVTADIRAYAAAGGKVALS